MGEIGVHRFPERITFTNDWYAQNALEEIKMKRDNGFINEKFIKYNTCVIWGGGFIKYNNITIYMCNMGGGVIKFA